jgi:hypothetical protein
MDNDHEHTDLGVNQKDINMGEGLPSTAPSKDEPEKVYPSFHYSGPKELTCQTRARWRSISARLPRPAALVRMAATGMNVALR